MKTVHFIVLIAAIAAVHMGLILGNMVEPLSVNSSGNILFDVITFTALFYMGWYLSRAGLKKVALDGTIAVVASFLVLCATVFIGHSMQRPVLGVNVASFNMIFVLLFFSGLVNIVLGVFFVVLGAWIALRFGPKRKKK